MSTVRMCDKCGTIFSELEDGYQSFTATTVKRDENGMTHNVQQAMDACPSCALIPKHQFQKELEAVASGDELQARIAKLERETGIADSAPTTR